MEMAFPSSYVVDCFPTYPPWSLLPPSDFVFSVNCTICSPSLRSAFSTFGSALANIDSIVVFRTVFYFSSLLYRETPDLKCRAQMTGLPPVLEGYRKGG